MQSPNITKSVLLSALAITSLCAASGVRADPTGNLAYQLFGTGEDNSRNLQSIGTADSHFSLTAAPAGAGPTAVVTSLAAGWVSNLSDAQWIGTDPNAGSQPTGFYTYKYTIDLTNFNPSTVDIKGLWSSDDASGILVNGTLVQSIPNYPNDTGAVPDAYENRHSFDLNSNFTAGVNTIEFSVSNSGGGPTGLLVEFTSGNGSPIPEASTMLGFGSLIGLGGLGVLRRRRSVK